MVLFPPQLSSYFTVTCNTPRLTIRWHHGRWSPRFFSKCWKCWMKAKLISFEIAQNRLRSWPFILSFPLHLKEEFLFVQRGPYAYKGPGGQNHPFTAHKLANTRALLHLHGRHNFSFLLFSPVLLYKISKYPKLPMCFIILLYCWSLDIFKKYIIWMQIVEFL